MSQIKIVMENMKIFKFLESCESRNVFTRTFYGHAVEQFRTL